jgi:hypothetical protein
VLSQSADNIDYLQLPANGLLPSGSSRSGILSTGEPLHNACVDSIPPSNNRGNTLFLKSCFASCYYGLSSLLSYCVEKIYDVYFLFIYLFFKRPISKPCVH